MYSIFMVRIIPKLCLSFKDSFTKIDHGQNEGSEGHTILAGSLFVPRVNSNLQNFIANREPDSGLMPLNFKRLTQLLTYCHLFTL